MRNTFRRFSAGTTELNGSAPVRSFGSEAGPVSERHVQRLPTGEPTDHVLIGRSRDGDQDAANALYARYAQRLTTLVQRQCSTMLARCAGVEDIVQSVFGSFFRRIGQSYYDVPAGEELWKLLLVIALNKIRSKATFYHAAKRDAQRTVGGVEAQHFLESRATASASASEQLDLALKEIIERLPAQNQAMVRLRLDGCEVAEVAQATGRSRRSVERILQETRLMLTELLREED